MRVILRGASYRMDQSPKCEQYTKSVEEKPLPETNDNCHLPTLVPKCSRPHKQSDRTSNRSYIQLQVSLHISETRLAGPAYPYELGIPRHKNGPWSTLFSGTLLEQQTAARRSSSLGWFLALDLMRHSSRVYLAVWLIQRGPL
jgi:hypothetical protein